ncbi:MAG: DegT/DnrJ/EryC1/StrS family aminotransferase [Desulfamplus sp.]|nr:DegT/DnrJ/EryC1/StrS family aminotransferase [Desulfamplus sp.]
MANTAIPTVTAIQTIGAVPVFCEIHPQSWLLDHARIHDLVTVRTRAIIPVHLFGNMVDMEPLLEVARHHQLPVIEDTAQAFGACYQGKQAGTIGDFGAFSFYPSKNLGALGDAGAVFCRSAEAAQLLRQLRNYGQSDRYHASIPQGRNTRLDEIQAAILRVKLQHVHRWNQQRNHWVGVYQDLLKQANLPLMTVKPTAQTEPAWHLMAVRLYHGAETRDQLQQYLKQCGIGTLIHYPHILSSQPAFAHYNQRPLPITEAHCNEVLSLPLHPYLSEAQIHEVCSAIRHFF